MNCPNCQTIMSQVKVPSVNAGLFVVLEQCPHCGGLWLDRYEMVQVPHDEAFKIDSIDKEALQKSVTIRENLICPLDKSPLLRLKDINIPENTAISRCRKCEGIWMNRGEFTLYKKHIEQRQKDNPLNLQSKPTEIFSASEQMEAQMKVISAIGTQILPMPLNFVASKIYPKKEFTLTDEGVKLLEGVPPAKKMEIYRLMAEEHNQNQERERRFVNATVNILNIISRLLLRF